MPMNCSENTIEELQNYKERLSLALRAADICIFEVDLQQQLYTFFDNSESIFGVPGDQILREVQPFSKLEPEEYRKAVSAYFSHPDDVPVIRTAFESIFSGRSASYHARMKAGETDFVWCKVDVAPVMEKGVPVKMIGVITDFNQTKSEMDKLKQTAEFDGLTGLYRKRHAEGMIADVLCRHPDQKHALIFIDLDNFKHINDTHGHMTGDQIIQSISSDLKRICRKSDIVGRFGGDEFFILLRDIEDEEALLSKIDRIRQIRSDSCTVTMSIGASMYPDNARTFQQLFETADKALYAAKDSKNNYALYSSLSPH